MKIRHLEVLKFYIFIKNTSQEKNSQFTKSCFSNKIKVFNTKLFQFSSEFCLYFRNSETCRFVPLSLINIGQIPKLILLFCFRAKQGED